MLTVPAHCSTWWIQFPTGFPKCCLGALLLAAASSKSQVGDIVTSTHQPANDDGPVTDEVAILRGCVCVMIFFFQFIIILILNFRILNNKCVSTVYVNKRIKKSIHN